MVSKIIKLIEAEWWFPGTTRIRKRAAVQWSSKFSYARLSMQEFLDIFCNSNVLCVSKFKKVDLILGKGNGNPLQYSGLEKPKDGGAWWAVV